MISEILLGQIPQAVFVSLFIIFTKQLKEKRVLFVFLMSITYVAILMAFPYNMWLYLVYVALTFLTLKVLYGEQAYITDTITFFISITLLGIISVPILLVTSLSMEIKSVILMPMLYLTLFIIKNHLPKIEKFYMDFWNRHTNPKVIKSITIRALCAIIVNIVLFFAYVVLKYVLMDWGELYERLEFYVGFLG